VAQGESEVDNANQQVISTSQMYASESSPEIGIASVKTNGGAETIKDATRLSPGGDGRCIEGIGGHPRAGLERWKHHSTA